MSTMNEETEYYSTMKLTGIIDEKLGNLDCYVAAKCLIVGKTEEYLQDGGIAYSYDVVFTWNQKNNYCCPIYGEDKRCKNKVHVNQIYENVDEAILVAHELSKNSLIEKIMESPIDQMDEIRKKGTIIADEFYRLEKEHLEQGQKAKIK